MTKEVRPESPGSGTPLNIVAVHEVEPPEEGRMSFKEMEYRWPGEWIVAQVIPNSEFLTTIYRAPDYIPDSQEEQPYMGIVLAHSGVGNEIQPALKRENAPLEIFRSEEVNRTQAERDLVVAEAFGYALSQIPRRLANWLRKPAFDHKLGRWMDKSEDALKELDGMIEQHREWAESVLDDPEANWGESFSQKPTTQKEWRAYRQIVNTRPAAVISAIAGHTIGLKFLGAVLVVEDLNPKLYYAHFLGNLTDEQVGKRRSYFPPRDLIIEWAEKIRDHQVLYPPKLEQLMAIYKAVSRP